jgi:MoxR-like ATPase
MSASIIQRLQDSILAPLKQRFVGRDEVIDLIALAAVAGEHLFLHGPPGTAKSALVRQFALALHGQYFEYMLTRFSEPNEIFGPVDIAKLREGQVITVTTGMLPEAEFVFLDELFNANSAILNNLLTVLNERIYRRGLETHRLPLVSLFSASNHLPEDEALRSLFDRFLLRVHVENLPREAMPQLLAAGWALEQSEPLPAAVSAAELRSLTAKVYGIGLAPMKETYLETVFKLRDLGLAFSDRRAVKVLKLAAASALLCGREAAQPADLWVLRYVWDREEQIDPLAALVNGILAQQKDQPAKHPLAAVREPPRGEDLARQFDQIEQQLVTEKPTLTVLGRVKEEVARLADQAAWLSDARTRSHLLGRAKQLLERLG